MRTEEKRVCDLNPNEIIILLKGYLFTDSQIEQTLTQIDLESTILWEKYKTEEDDSFVVTEPEIYDKLMDVKNLRKLMDKNDNN